MKIKKRNLLLVLLLTLFLTLPTTCFAEEAPPIKWESIKNDKGDRNIYTGLYNINNDILAVHALDKYTWNIRLLNDSGKEKWEYKQEKSLSEPYFIMNNEYLGIINLLQPSSDNNYITLLNIKNGTVYKKIDISKIVDKDNLHYGLSIPLCAYYYNDKIVLLFYYHNNKQYYFYTLDMDGNVEISKKGPYYIEYYNAYYHKQIIIDNSIYSMNKNKIIVISMDTGEITKEIPFNSNNTSIKNIIKYKDGILLCGSLNGYMTIQYYNLKNDNIKIKQFKEEGEINTITIDNKDNLYIAGKYIDDNTTGKAYLAKYTINNWNFQKIYESFYEKEEVDEYFYTDMLLLKNNKLVLAGNTYDFGKYREGLNYIVYYDGTKNYKIDKVIKGSGNIDIIESEEEDNEVKYQVKPGFGYKLISLKIVTESGKEIKVSDDYSFIMPDENITITAIFEPIINNPVTGNNILKILLELIISISVVYLITNILKKKNKFTS